MLSEEILILTCVSNNLKIATVAGSAAYFVQTYFKHYIYIQNIYVYMNILNENV